MLCSPARQLVTWISFRVHSPCCSITLCANATLCVWGMYVCCRSLVLYSLCHTEYWLGGRWLNGSCLALLMLFIFLCCSFYLLSSFICRLWAFSCSLCFVTYIQSINICRQCQLSAPAGDTRCTNSNTFTVFPLSSLLLLCKRSLFL